LNRGDIERWVSDVFYARELAEEIAEIRSEPGDINEKLDKLKKAINSWIT
jgi:hypothetical protein